MAVFHYRKFAKEKIFKLTIPTQLLKWTDQNGATKHNSGFLNRNSQRASKHILNYIFFQERIMLFVMLMYETCN